LWTSDQNETYGRAINLLVQKMSKMSLKNINWPLIVSAYLTLFALGLLDNARGPFFPDITAALKISDTQASFFFVTVSLTAFFSGRVVPTLVNRFGLMNVIRAGLVLMGLGFVAVSRASDFISMIVTCFIFGYGFGLLNVAQNLMIIRGASDVGWRRRLLSGLHGMYAFSSILAPLGAAYFFNNQISWRWAFVFFAAFSLISLASTFFVKNLRSVTGDEQHKRHPTPKVYWLVASQLSFYILAEILLTTRLSLYVRRTFDYQPEDAAMMLSVFFVLLLFGRLVFLFLPIRAATPFVIKWSLVLSFVFNVLGLALNPWLLVICGLTMAPVFALSLDYLAEIFPSYSADAIASCLAISCIYIVSMHFGMGLLTDKIGIQNAMWAGPVFTLVSFVLLVIIGNRKTHNALV